jgi:aminopeptidase N
MLKAILHRDQMDLGAMTNAFAKLVADPSLDHGYKASILTMPSEAYIAEQMDEVDPGFIRTSRDQLRATLTSALKESLQSIDQTLRTQPCAAYSPDPLSTGRRCLANLAQHWLAISGDISAQTLLERYRASSNMTDRMAVLGALVEIDTIESETALALYLDQFRDHALAMDKWFTVQVMMTNATALDRVRGLLSHQLFNVANPNRVRSVLGAYFNSNLPGFHRKDGAGYALWAEQVLSIDQRNSQLASRMARALDRWSHFEPTRKAAMKAALEKVAASETLSSDVREVVTKALAAAD